VTVAPSPDLGAVLASLPIAALLIDPDGRVAQANAACEQLLNRSERALAGQPVQAVLTVPSGYRAREGFTLFDGEFETSRGVRFRADFVAAPIADHPGWQAITLHTALGPRRMPAASARAATGAAAMLAHEIRNPLSGIRGAAQLLTAGGPADPALTGLITAEVDRIAALIDRMQDFTDTRPLTLEPHNVHPLIDHVRRLAVAGVAAAVGIDERFDPSLPPARLDRDAFVQVLLNLVRNAVEAGAGRITLSSAYRPGVAVSTADGEPRRPLPIEVSVADDGPGVPADILDQMFDPFVSGRPEGRGLGLALVDKLAGQMGGIVQHAREGGRTVFRLLLARAPA
jgi:two-component system, NtrC family, nitrogen regulation sensor histidine kinase GlnL